MTALAYERVHENLKKLKLTTIESVLDKYLEAAVKEDIPAIEMLDYLLEEEHKARASRRRSMNLKMAKLPYIKRIDDFDFYFQPCIDYSVIKELKTLRFVYNGENVIFLGPPGVGKTHLSIGLGMEALDAGLRIYFINATVLVEKLVLADNDGTIQKYLKSLNSFDILIIDEMGYLPMDKHSAYCFFQLINARYEKKSIIFTSNKSYSQWGDIFNDNVIATAILDRILHHSTTFNIKGKSFRMAGKSKQPPQTGLYNTTSE